MLRAVLFDFNGTLVDDEPLHLEMFQRVLAEEGVTLSREDYYRSYLAMDDRGCFCAALAAAGETAEPSRLARLVARKASYYRERIRRGGYPFFAGALARVEEMAAAGLALGVVSGALREEVVGALEQAGVRGRFKALVTAEDVGESKPSPQGYLRALETLNTQPPLPVRLFHPHEVLAIEDSPAGLAAASAAGLSTLGVAHTYPAAELAADLVIGRLADLRLPALLAHFG